MSNAAEMSRLARNRKRVPAGAKSGKGGQFREEKPGGKRAQAAAVGVLDYAPTTTPQPAAVTGSGKQGTATKGAARRNKMAEVMNQLRDRVLNDLQTGEPGKWTPPWVVRGALSLPGNPKSKHLYSGINYFNLLFNAVDKEYSNASWATYKQWQEMGCQVRKGEKGSKIVRPIKLRCCEDKNCVDGQICGNTGSKILWSDSTVFNVAQVNGEQFPPHPKQAEDDKLPKMAAADKEEAEKSAAVLIDGLGVKMVQSSRGKAAYSFSRDVVEMPPVEDFESPKHYLATLAHELVHWTGHESRENRKHGSAVELDGISDYAREELVAEFGSALLTARLGIEHKPRGGGHEKYLAHWVKMLSNDDGPDELRKAMSKAFQAVERIMGILESGQPQNNDESGGDATPTEADELLVIQPIVH